MGRVVVGGLAVEDGANVGFAVIKEAYEDVVVVLSTDADAGFSR